MREEARLKALLRKVRACTHCREHLPLGPKPVLEAAASAKVLVVGQAPGTKVHRTGVPWNDPSGDKLRLWMDLDRRLFYDKSRVAIVPMGFCYPGKGKSGDLPPREECAPLWHEKILRLLPQLRLTLLIGQYSQNYYLKGDYATLTDRVRDWRRFVPRYLPLPHPSPRNRLWLMRNPWFEKEVVPHLQRLVHSLIKNHG